MGNQIDLHLRSASAQENWDHVQYQFQQWANTFNIQKEISQAVQSSIPWTKYCSPKAASQESMLLAFMYVALFFYLDDYQGDNFEEVCDRCLEILDGAVPHQNDSQIIHAFFDFLQKLAGQGQNIAGFINWAAKVIDIYKWRYSIKQDQTRIDLGTYQTIRAVTINVYPWWELWQILGGFPLTAAEKKMPEMQSFLNLAAAVMYLANDIYSLERDLQKNELNYISILSDEGRITSADAFHLTRILLYQRREEFEQAFARILEISDRTNVRQFANFVKSVVDTGFDILKSGGHGRYALNQYNAEAYQKGFNFLHAVYRQKKTFQSFISLSSDMKAPVANPANLYPGLTEFPPEIFTTMIITDLILKDKPDLTLRSDLLDAMQAYHCEGIFNFFYDDCLLPADIDCTAIGVSILLETGHIEPATAHRVADKILETVSEEGIIEVYFPPCGHRRYVDPVVCVNALYLLTLLDRAADAQKTQDYIDDYLRSKGYLEGTRYYPSPDIFLFFLARLMHKFPYYRERFKVQLQAALHIRMGTTSTPLDLAARVFAARVAGIANELDESRLVLSQNGHGEWFADAFFQFGKRHGYFGCDALTTAFAIRALEPEIPQALAHLPPAYAPDNGKNGRSLV